MRNPTLLAAAALLLPLLRCASQDGAGGPAAARPEASSMTSASPVFLFAGGWVVREPGAPAERLTISVRDGRILRVAKDSEFDAERAAGAQVLEMSPYCLLPGLTDAHGHVFMTAEGMVSIPLAGRPKKEILEAVRQGASERRALKRENPTEWILGRGWDQTKWPGGGMPDRAELDAVSPVNPVLLNRVDEHAIWVNSAALAIAGITRETKDPDGGRILRDAAGVPTGVLIDKAAELVESKVPPPTEEQIRTMLHVSFRRLLEAGLTEVHDAGLASNKELAPVVFRQLESLAEAGELPIRIYAMLPTNSPREWYESQLRIGPRKIGRDDRLRVRAVKIYIDGALGSRGAALLDPYSDDPENRGLLFTGEAELRRLAREATDAGFQLAMHAIGDRANRLALDTVEELRRRKGSRIAELRPRIEHAQIIDSADIPRFSKLGVIASMQPTHATSDMAWAGERLGEKRLAGAYAWKSLLRSGARLAFGSDFPIESAAWTYGLYSATTRADLDGRPAGGWQPQELLTRTEAFAAFTTGAAYSAFEENDRGRIAPGFRADFTGYREDVLEIPLRMLPGFPAQIVVVGGKVVYTRGR